MTQANDLNEEQRLKIFEEGMQAAAAGQSPLVCPYIQDTEEFRFLAWLDGFRSVNQTGGAPRVPLKRAPFR